mgnify:CR=1 FL=1
MGDGGYIGYAGASSTEVSVVADIAESLDISGFTPSIAVSSMPALVVSSMVLATPMAVSGTVTTAAPVNQNVSGISLDAIAVDAAAIEALLTLANVDHAANEVLLTGIDADTNAIKVDTAANEVLLTGIDTVLDNILTKNTEIDTALDTIDAVLDSSLTKQTEIDAVLDTIKIDTEAIETATEAIQTDAAAIEVLLTGIDVDTDAIKTDAAAMEVLLTGIDADTDAIKTDAAAIEVLLTNANTDHAANEVLLTAIDTVLDTIKVDTEAIETAAEAIQVDTAANEVLLTSIKTAVETIDNAIDGNYLNVNANIAGTDFVGGAGAVNAGTLRTTLATDDSSLGILEAIRAELVTGTQTIAGTVTVAVPAALGVVSNGTVGGSQRVTLANDSDGRVAVVPSKDAYLSHVYIDLDAAGDNPTTNTEVIAAGGASTKLVIYGIQGSIVGSAAAAAGNWYLSDGNTSAATTLWTGRAQGLTNTQFELTFPYGVALTTNTALKVTSSEAANNIFINAVVYYRTEAV